jgi:hypothetical protein
MPKRPAKSVKKAPAKEKKIATKAKKTAGKIKGQRMAATGLNSRIKGHVSASGKRSQARRDSR